MAIKKTQKKHYSEQRIYFVRPIMITTILLTSGLSYTHVFICNFTALYTWTAIVNLNQLFDESSLLSSSLSFFSFSLSLSDIQLKEQLEERPGEETHCLSLNRKLLLVLRSSNPFSFFLLFYCFFYFIFGFETCIFTVRVHLLLVPIK